MYRQVNDRYAGDYDHLLGSGLYEHLVAAGLLIPHEEVALPAPKPELAYKVLQPDAVPFISYPYEWCFSQLKDAALTLLRIQKTCMDFDMSLKDCSAYNIQFVNGKPVLIDTLSFEKYREGSPWVAYRQFCQHFLAPLALMAYKDARLNGLLRVFIDGIPLDVASSLLPSRTHLSFTLLSHIHLHARSQKRFADRTTGVGSYRMRRSALTGVIESLSSAVNKLKWEPHKTEWAEYYEHTSYSREAFERKKQLVGELLDRIDPQSVWDLGANVGIFSRLASDRGIQTVSLDVDPAAVEKNYLASVRNKETCLLPLVLDLTNPSPAIGWENDERMSLAQRGPADTVIALALIHHLTISNNVPFDRVAGFFSRISRNLIAEFVPKTDPQVQRLLATREDIFTDYSETALEREFGRHFSILDSLRIGDSGRVLYLMTVKES